MKISAAIILSVLASALLWLTLISNFTNFMAGVLIVLGSLSFMWAVAEGVYWFLRSDEK